MAKANKSDPITVRIARATLEEYGATNIDYTGDGAHYKVTYRANGTPHKTTCAKTPSDHRAFMNIRRDAKASALDAGLTVVVPYAGPEPIGGVEVALRLMKKGLSHFSIKIPGNGAKHKLYEVIGTPKGFRLIPKEKGDKGARVFISITNSEYLRCNLRNTNSRTTPHSFEEVHTKFVEVPASLHDDGVIKIEAIPAFFKEPKEAPKAEVATLEVVKTEGPTLDGVKGRFVEFANFMNTNGFTATVIDGELSFAFKTGIPIASVDRPQARAAE